MDSATKSQDKNRILASETSLTVTDVMIAINPNQPQQQVSTFATINAEETIVTPPPTAELAVSNLSPPEFDFNLPCRYFKSSFARSLSLNSSGGQSKSMDFITTNSKNSFQTMSPPLSSTTVPNRKCSTDSCANEGSGFRNYEISPVDAAVPPIPARRQNIETSAVIPTANAVNAVHLLSNGSIRATAANGSGNIVSRVPPHGANGGSSHFVRRNVCWPQPPPPPMPSSSSASSSGEQECQLLEADHEMKLTAEFTENRFEVVDPSTNVEAVILQNQVDTLQWQLKQAETSCGMYRAVMEEVARFLERFQKNAACSRSEQISRSKSMHHVYAELDKGSESGNSSAYLRARSSTNLIDLKRMSPNSFGGDSTKSSGDDHYDLASPANSYNTFKDFTWRRSPKKRGDCKLSPGDEAEEKLNKEAFRLSRTIHNLLHTQQPDLTQHRQSLGSARIKPPMPNPLPDTSAPQKAILTREMLFLRTMNMRDSRLSLRSSTDSSVHSTSSSSKVETDEENYPPPMLSKQLSNLCSTTEDESGFSSISSFQEIGVPLCSTMISSPAGSSRQDVTTTDQSDFNLDSRNSTLKATPSSSPPALTNNVGVPVAGEPSRWDSKTYRNKFQRFSTLSNEDSATVLWV